MSRHSENSVVETEGGEVYLDDQHLAVPNDFTSDSAYYGSDVIGAATRQGTRFSITARQDKAVRAAIARIEPDSRTTIKYTSAIFDEDQQR